MFDFILKRHSNHYNMTVFARPPDAITMANAQSFPMLIAIVNALITPVYLILRQTSDAII